MQPTSSDSLRSLSLPWSDATTPTGHPLAKLLWGLYGVVRFELLRSLSVVRLFGWSLMIAFPIGLVLLAKWQIDEFGRGISPREMFITFGFILYAILPQVATMLCLLLWATPAINSELEGQTWIYAIVRPSGRTTLMLGKYLVAVFWSITGGVISTSILVPLLGFESSWTLWWTMCRLIVLASIAYAALYIMLGTLIQRRAMVAAFVYTLVIEGFLSFLPAAINQLTISFRLRNLLVQWLNIELPSNMRNANQIFDLTGIWHHLAAIGIYTVVCLGISIFWIRRSEYSLQPETA